MIKRRSPRQQKQKMAKVQNESHPQTSGLKRSKMVEEGNSKKRKASDSVYSVGRKRSSFDEKSANKQKDSDEAYDNYCWKCHKYCQEEKCSTCIRVYCFKCFKGQDNQICEACRHQNASEDAFSTIADTSSLLISVIETSFPENKIGNERLFIWRPKASEEKLCHIVDYTYIDSKSKDTDGLQYRSPAELLDDVKWMYHNCVIIYGEQHDITKEAKKIMKKFAQEIEDLNDCAECYRKRFLNICDTPHPLIMAKQKSFSPWPAKCLRVLDSKAHVRYFGSHEMAKVPLKDCFFVYKGCVDKKKSKTFEEAKEEFNDYITLFEDTFGEEYPYQPEGTSFKEEVGINLMERVKEKYQKAQKESRTETQKRANRRTNSTGRVIDLTENDDHREYKVPLHMFSEVNEQPHHPNSVHSLLASWIGNPAPSGNFFPPSGSQNNNFSPGQYLPYNTQARNNFLLPTYSPANESGISISNVYSSSDPIPLPDCDLNAQDTSLASDSSHSIRTVPNLGIPPSCTMAEPDNNSREEVDDDIQVIEEISSDTHRRINLKNIDEHLVQVILCRDPAAYSILQAANCLVRQLFVQFWGMANGIPNAPAILSAQEEKIKKLKTDLAKLLKECDDRVANADSILKSIYAAKCDSLYKKIKDLEETINNISNERDYYKNSLDRHKEVIKDYKLNTYCCKCKEIASIFCCNNGNVITCYCSTKCQKENENIHSIHCSRKKQDQSESTEAVLEFSKTVKKIIMTKKIGGQGS